jgi:UDP-GlcNAc:undecaprenyl-phosphate/decaprenyl-phosphate GlcNAc-1-phosphate transferase
MDPISYLLLIITVLLSSAVSVRLVKGLGVKNGWIAIIREDRWHESIAALHGGVGFYPALLMGMIIVLISYYQHSQLDSGELLLLMSLISGSFIMFIFGLADDILQFKPVTKLIIQSIAASLFIVAGGVYPLSDNNSFNIIITYIWIIGLTNAVNMLDNMDGLTTGIVIIASLAVMMYTFLIGQSQFPAFYICGVLSVALFGFWLFNFPPASIFMGDSGSLSIGYLIGALTIPSSLNGVFGFSRENGHIFSYLFLLIPLIILAVPIFDTTFVVISRIRRSVKIYQGGRDHTSHSFILKGFSENKTLFLLYSIGLLGGAIPIFLLYSQVLFLLLSSVYLVTIFLIGAYLSNDKH